MASRNIRSASIDTVLVRNMTTRARSRVMSTDTGIEELINRRNIVNRVPAIAEDIDGNASKKDVSASDDDTVNNVGADPSFSAFLSRQPIVVLNRVHTAESVVGANRVGEGVGQSSNSGSGVVSSEANRVGDEGGQTSNSGASVVSSQASDSSDSERLVFLRYEFLAGLQQKNTLLYVHDIEHLYSFRNKTNNGVVYQCRSRNKCSAKVIVNELGVCTQYNSVSHSHPSVRGEYENLIFRHRLREQVDTEDFSQRNRNLRKIYDEQRRA